jgi:hypothetical protein
LGRRVHDREQEQCRRSSSNPACEKHVNHLPGKSGNCIRPAIETDGKIPNW